MSRPTYTINMDKSSWLATVHHNGKRYRRRFPAKRAAATWAEHTVTNIVLDGTDQFCGHMKPLIEKALTKHYKGMKSYKSFVSVAQLVVDKCGDMRIDAMTPPVLERLSDDWVNEGLSNATVNRRLSFIKTCLTLAVRWGYLDRAPEFNWKREGSSQRRKAIPRDHLKMIVDHFVSIDEATMARMVVFMVSTGLRLNEACDVTFAHLDRDADRVTVTSGKHNNSPSGTIPYGPEVRRLVGIQAHTANPSGAPGCNLADVPLFHDMPYHRFRYLWRKMQAVTGFTYVPHSLRHTFCTRLVEAGIPLATVKTLARHRSMHTTMRYVHGSPDMDADVRQVMTRAVTWGTP